MSSKPSKKQNAGDGSEIEGLKQVIWLGSSKKGWMSFPEEIQDLFGTALREVQRGGFPEIAKPLKGIGEKVLELVDEYDGEAYRGVYTVKFQGVIYVLHALHKKSHKGGKLPREDKEVIEKRFKNARAHYEQLMQRLEAQKAAATAGAVALSSSANKKEEGQVGKNTRRRRR